jgi:DNA-binding response OmpR family regulator
MKKTRILIVEDDPDIAETIEYNLQQEGFATRSVDDGLRALKEVEAFRPDLIVLDVMLPGLDGFEICKRLKSEERTNKIAVLMLTVRSSEVDVVLGLELGADDYVTKPFSPRVLVARIKTLLRREKTAAPEAGRIEYAGLVINRDKHEVLVEGDPVPFSKTEFEILAFLASKPGKVFSRDLILESCWPDGVFVVDRSVDVHINSIRKKLGPLGGHVETVRGVGYRMREFSDE